MKDGEKSSIRRENLHAALIKDQRFTQIGLRKEGVFLGDRDHDGTPIPDFVGAKPENLLSLMDDWLEENEKLTHDDLDPVFHAVIIAFSFVYIHPLEDGNGRLHRYLLHHVLGKRGFYPQGMIFPISSVILNEIETYRDVLIDHSAPLMEFIQWNPTQKGNVTVTNDTIDFYRYFDCTQECEFIYNCVEKTINETLPAELKYLEAYDKSFVEIQQIIEMPDNEIKKLMTFILQNKGVLSTRKKESFFPQLRIEEQIQIQEIIKHYF